MNLPFWLLTNIGLLISSSFVLVLFGERLPRRGDWIAFTALSSVLISIGMYWAGYLGSPDELSGAVGWVFRAEDARALRLGISADVLALLFTFTSALTGLLLLVLVQPKLLEFHPFPFALASVTLTLAGAAVSFLSTTPWLFAVGASLSLVGGAFSYRWHLAKKSGGGDAERFLRERLWSLLLIVVGSAAWASQGIEIRSDLGGDRFASSLGVFALGAIHLGVLIQCQALPFIGIHLESLESSPSLRLFTTQLLPSWSALVFLFRFHESFGPVGLHPLAGWVGVVLAGLSAAAGLMQREWRSAIPILGSTISLLAFAVLNLVGPGAAFCVLMGCGLGLLGLSLTAEMTEGAIQRPPVILQVPVFIAGAAISGVIGAASVSGFASWAQAYMASPWEFASVLLVIGALSIQTWRLAWVIIGKQGVPSLSWWKFSLLALFPMGGMSLLWTGVPIQGFESLFSGLSPLALPAFEAEAGSQSLAILQGLVIFGVVAGAWATASKGDRIQYAWQRFPRLSAFVAGGFGFDAMFGFLVLGLVRAGRWIDRGSHQALWGEWLPRAFSSTIWFVARPAFSADRRLRKVIDQTASESADFPGRLAQLIQNGDVQWYLFFAISCTFGLLVHFLLQL